MQKVNTVIKLRLEVLRVEEKQSVTVAEETVSLRSVRTT